MKPGNHEDVAVARQLALFLLLVFASASGAAQNAPTDPAARSATGRWSVTFDIPQQQYRTIVELAASADGGLTATNLGYPLLQFKEGTLAGNQLLLKGTSTYGLFEIRATLAGDRFDGRWQVAFLGGDVHGVRDSAARPGRSRLRVFDEVWAAIDRRFYDPRFNGVDWQGARARYRPQAAVALTDAALATVIRKMLGELRSSHPGFSALPLQESFVASAAKPAAVSPPPITWRTIAPGVGYIQIKQFEEGYSRGRSRCRAGCRRSKERSRRPGPRPRLDIPASRPAIRPSSHRVRGRSIPEPTQSGHHSLDGVGHSFAGLLAVLYAMAYPRRGSACGNRAQRARCER